MADNRTMAELLQAPTEGYEDAIRDCSEIEASKFWIKHGLLTLYSLKLRRRCKAIVAKVSTSASTSGVSPDIAELKDMVRALLLDKLDIPVPAPLP
ncbi:hypothetical protein Tco_1362710 [Tanacetum coccineum]